MPDDPAQPIFESPLVGYADGDDPLFMQYKTVIGPEHRTPHEAIARAYGRQPDNLPRRLSVISWILPVARKTRLSNRVARTQPSRLWAFTRWYGEQFNEALRAHVVDMLTGKGCLATAPGIGPDFKQERNEKGPFSNWSERHIAYAAGLGTFSLSDGFITEKGIAHRCGSVVTDLPLPASERTAATAFSNCTYYVNGGCRACIARCPAGAISEAGHDKDRCYQYTRCQFKPLREELKVGNTGCGLCQTGVPCEARNPVKRKK
jgi:ferredoxin